MQSTAISDFLGMVASVGSFARVLFLAALAVALVGVGLEKHHHHVAHS